MGGCLLDDDSRKYASLSHRQSFAMSGMATQSLGVGWTLGSQGWMSAGYTHFGDHDYAEQQLSVGGGMRLDDWIDLGVEGRYCHLGSGDGFYETDRWVAVAVRTAVRVDKKWIFSVLAGSRPWDSVRPWRMHLNAMFTSPGGLLSVVELESEETFRFRCGVEYCYREHFLFRVGMATRPVLLTFGLGLRYDRYCFDLAAEVHNTLGITPHISMSLCL